MKLVKIKYLEDYLTAVGAYDNPKTLKIVQVNEVSEVEYWIKAITFPVTHQIQWFEKFEGSMAQDSTKEKVDKLIANGHMRGSVQDITTGPRI